MQVQLEETSLGVLPLGCDPYVVSQLQIGSPVVREVMRDRALADGAYDDTRYLGARAVTVTCRLRNSPVCRGAADMQALIDRVVPYMSPRVRPTLSYQLPGSDQVRSMVVRGVSWPVAIDGPKYPTVPLQFICATGEIFSGTAGDETCVTIRPSTDTEGGRVYDLTFDRVYPPGGPTGARIVTNEGTAPAHWKLTIFGGVTNPGFDVNGVDLRFDRNGGLVLLPGEHVLVDTRARTALRNSDPAFSVYDRMNYEDWAWADLLLRPGDNSVRFFGTGLSASAMATLCWRSTWLA